MITATSNAFRLVNEAIRNAAQGDAVDGHLYAIGEAIPALSSITCTNSEKRRLVIELMGHGVMFAVEPQHPHLHPQDPSAMFKVCVSTLDRHLLVVPRENQTKYRFTVYGDGGVLYDAAEYGRNRTEALTLLLTHRPANPRQHEMLQIDIHPAHPGEL